MAHTLQSETMHDIALRCARCRYDLNGLADDGEPDRFRCPECGHITAFVSTMEPENEPFCALGDRRWWTLAASPLLFLVVALFLSALSPVLGAVAGLYYCLQSLIMALVIPALSADTRPDRPRDEVSAAWKQFLAQLMLLLVSYFILLGMAVTVGLRLYA